MLLWYVKAMDSIAEKVICRYVSASKDGGMSEPRYRALASLVKKHDGVINGVEREYVLVNFPSDRQASIFWRDAEHHKFSCEESSDASLRVYDVS